MKHKHCDEGQYFFVEPIPYFPSVDKERSTATGEIDCDIHIFVTMAKV
jgi:hypothetical protein